MAFTSYVTTTVTGETVISGTQSIARDGIANNTTIDASGNQNVIGGVVYSWNYVSSIFDIVGYNSGVANSTTINSGGYQCISDGGVANNTTINTGGSQYVSLGGFTFGMFISSCGVANSTTINSGGCQGVFNGSANFTTINSGGSQRVEYDGMASNTIINSGFQTISSHGWAGSTTINSGGLQDVRSGGVVIFTTINSGGDQYVHHGGAAYNTTINADGEQYVSGGTTSNTIVNSGGSLYVSTGGYVSGTLTIAGGHIVLDNPASISGLTALSYVLTAAKTNDAMFTVNNGVWNIETAAYSLNLDNTEAGTYILVDGVDLSDLRSKTFSVTDNGQKSYLEVGSSYTFSNGDKLSLNFNDSTRDQLTATIMATLPKITIAVTDATAAEPSDNGTYRISRTGDTTSALTVNFSTGGTATSGGDYTLKNGSTALTNSVVIAAGQSYVDITLAVIDDVIAEGTETAVMNLTANAAYSLGATTSGTINITDDDKFTAIVSSMTVTGETVSSGTQSIVNGGITNNTTITFGGRQDVSSSGFADSTTINNNGMQNVSSGGVANNTTINSGWQFVLLGGETNYTNLNSYQTLIGVANSTTINSGGVQTINNGIANSTIINYMGRQNVAHYGVATSTIINSGGSQSVLFGGTANSTIINSYGEQDVNSGGVASNTIVNSGGYQNLSSGGLASNTTVNSGGSMYVSSGGVVAGMLTIGGGHVTVKNINSLNQAAMVFKLANTQINDTLLTIQSGAVDDISHNTFTLDVNNTATGTYILESGADLGGMSSAVFTVKDNGQVIYAQVGYSYTLADGDKLSISLTDGATRLTAAFTLDTFPPSTPAGLTQTITGNNVALDWNDSTDAESGVKQYQVMVDNNSNFSSAEYSASAVASAATVNSLADGIYYWKVRSQDNAGNYSDWANGGSFMIDITAPAVPATLTQTVTGNNVALDWADATDATSGVKQYEFQVDNNSDFSSTEYSSATVSSDAAATGLADGNYYWQVRTVDNAGNYSAWSTGSSFMIDITAPAVPATLTQTVTGNNVALDWADATDATSGVKQYEFQVDNNNDFSSNEKSGTAITSNASATGLTDGIYYWRVRAQDNSGNYSAWGAGSSFMIDATAPSIPATLTRTIAGNNLTFDWADATDAGGVKQYQVMVDNNADFSSPEYSSATVSSDAAATGLADGNYYWKVRTQDNSGNYSDWTSGSSFMVDITAPVPAALTRTVTGNNVTFDWADATDGTSGVKQYEYQVDNNADFSSNEKSGIVTASNATATGLADGNYYWKVRTQDNSGNYSDWTSGSSFTIDVTVPASPTTLTQSITGNNVALDWADAIDATSGIKQYEFQIDNNSDFSSNENSGTAATSNAAATGLADGTYYWRVRAQDNSGNYSAWGAGSSFMIDATAPSIPATLTRTIAGNNLTFDWADATDAGGVKQYQVMVDNNADFSSPEYSSATVSSDAAANGLADGIYYWKVRTQDNSGNYSAWSSGSSFTVDMTAPTVPVGLIQTVDGYFVHLRWAAATDATSGISSYEIQVNKNSDFSGATEYGGTTGINSDTPYVTDGNYYWRVRTQDNAGNYSAWSSGSSFTVDTTAPSVPATLTRTVSGSSVALDWADATDATSGVKNYLFQYATNAQFTGATQSIVTVSNANVSNLSDGTYFWKVRAVDNYGNYSDWTSGSSFMIDITAPAVPATLTRTVTGSSVALDWADAVDATSGVKQYEFQVDNNNDFSSNEKSGTAITSNASATGLTDGIYYWRVRAQDNSGNYSAWGAGSNFTVDITAPSKPATLTRTVTGNNVALDWADSTDNTSGLKNYLLQYASNNQFTGAVQNSISASDSSISGLSDGVYYWRVQAVDNIGNTSDWVTGASFSVDTVAPSVPSTLTRTVTGSSVVLDWADATDATSSVKQYEYQVDNNADFSSNEKSGIVTASNATTTGLADGTYFWKVRAVDNYGNYSDWTSGSSFMIDITAPAVPATLTRTVTGSSVALDWADAVDATSGVKQYEFQVDNNNDFSSNEKSGTVVASNTTATGLADGSYFWRVRTQDNSGNYSAWITGSSFTIDMTAPTVPATLTRTVTGNSVALDWADATDATSGVKQYEFQVDNNSDFSSNEKSGTVVTSNTNATGLADGSYCWRVRTQDNVGNYSDWSQGSSFTIDMTAPTVPATLTRTVTGNNVALDWADSTDNTSGLKNYLLQYASNNQFTGAVQNSISASDSSISGLSDGVYYWRVQAVDNIGNTSDWVTGASFSVDTVAPTTPVALTRTVTGNTAALDWSDATDAGSGVKQYQVMVDNNADFSSPEYSASAATNAATVNSLADGTYYWRVRTQDNSGNYSDWTAGNSFMLDITAPTVPSSLTKTLNGNNVVLDWNDALDNTSGVKQYDVQVDNNSNFSSPEYSKQVVDSQTSVEKLAVGTYYWHVRTQDNYGNWSNWSTSDNFIVELTPPTVPSGLKQTVTGSSVALDWNDSTDASGIKQYEVRADSNIDFSSPEYSTVVDVSAASTSLALGTYYWQVRAQDKSGNYSAWSSSSKFIVTPTDTGANTWQTAKDIGLGVDTWVGFGDTADFYKFTMTNAGMLTLGMTGLTGNADMALLNSAGTAIKTSANTGITNEAINNVALLAGTYYVKVAAGFGVNDASYNLSNTVKYFPVDKAANTWQTAQDISILDNWVGFGDSADYYKLTMTNAGTLTLGLTGLTGNADLALLNSAGTSLKTSANAGTANEAINNVALLAGTYYVKVATGFGVNDASYTLTHAEKYTPADKAANDYKTAQDISALDNWVGFGDTADFYKLTLTNAGTLTLGLTGLTGNADLALLNSAGTAIKTSANTGITSEVINGVSLLSGTYYVKVAAGYGVNDASYNLSNTVKYCPTDKAANTWQTALDISTLDNWVGFSDAADFYKLTMTNAGTLSLGLTGLSGNADLTLLSSTGMTLKTSANAGTANEAITGVSLLAGTYYVKVAAGYGVNDASYNLSNTVSYFPGDTSDQAGNTIAAAKLVDAPTQTGWVGFGDTDDYYRFDLASAAIGTLRLHDMTGGNADLTLYNAKGIQLKKSASLGALEDTLTSTLATGTYYARVNAVSGNIDYKLDFSKKDIVSGMLAS